MIIISICSIHTCSCFSFTIIALTFLFLFSLSLLFAANAYNPVDSFIISCGSSGTSSDDVISWSGDLNSHLLQHDSLSSSFSSFAVNTLKQSPSVNHVPYTSARLSESQFSYSFPVSSGQKFIRLFFYPTSYSGGFDRSDSFFSVTSGGFTLLKNFNASLTADANDRSDTVVREYIVNVNVGQSLNLTFTANKNSYAFVNGIQIVSMPTDLYYTKSYDPGFEYVSFSGKQYIIGNDSALESLRKFGELAVSCVLDDGTQRPSMNDVVWGLEFVLRLQENAEQRVESKEEEGRLLEENKESHDENIFSSSDELMID